MTTTPVPPELLAARLHDAQGNIDALEFMLDEVRRLHGHPRTERRNSGCISCGIVWPCPTAKAVGVTTPIWPEGWKR